MKEKVLVCDTLVYSHVIHFECIVFVLPKNLHVHVCCNLILFIKPFESMYELFCASDHHLLW